MQAAVEVGGDQLGRAGEEGLGEGWRRASGRVGAKSVDAR